MHANELPECLRSATTSLRKAERQLSRARDVLAATRDRDGGSPPPTVTLGCPLLVKVYAVARRDRDYLKKELEDPCSRASDKSYMRGQLRAYSRILSLMGEVPQEDQCNRT